MVAKMLATRYQLGREPRACSLVEPRGGGGAATGLMDNGAAEFSRDALWFGRQALVRPPAAPDGTERRRIPNGYVAAPVDVEQRRSARAVPFSAEC